MQTSNRREFLAAATGAALAAGCARPGPRPNILLAYSDDVSWPHKAAYGTKGLATPAFDRVAREGVLFTRSYTGAPSCTPSRSCTLTGQQLYRTREAGCLFGAFPSDLPIYTDQLKQAGYHVGYTAKGWGPGAWDALGRTEDPCGQPFNERKYRRDEIRDGLNVHDYSENFRDFLAARGEGQPFCFWFGATEAHRRYAKGAGAAAGKSIDDVSVPPFWPDDPEVRSDILDYYAEIEWFDDHLGRMLDMLQEAGELDNTLVVVTSDNGLPFPRAKTTLYDWGVRMPLAVRWGARAPGGRTVDDFVSHTDFAPTFLAAAGLEPPAAMTGRSLLPILESSKQGQVEAARDFAVTAVERHTWCRPDGAPYPSRMIRTADYLYIRNYEPDRWPAGDPGFESPHQGLYGDIDACPTKDFMLANRERFPAEFDLSFGKRPAEELYRPADDPGQVRNLADDPAHAEAKRTIARRLDDYLIATGDPRSRGESPWDSYPYYFGDLDPRRRA